ncbi:MAG: class I SAM-dependent methyltransferase [Acidimicrobiia bacterium]|nr:class I SAM-dependent methyltransferase [Acidimicrobiia bacterium]
MRRRTKLIPWQVAGRVTERQDDTDEVVRTTGWVFNNETGGALTLEEFVETGDNEVPVYLQRFGLESEHDETRTLVEIGCGIGRMTCAFTRRFGIVYACDLDGGFLERCRQAVARYGIVSRLRTIEVADGRSLAVPDGRADVVFSYITLQHCDRDDALALLREAVRVARPGGRIALNFRTWSGLDPVLVPVGGLVRALFRVPAIGPWLSRRRLATRLAWQANRLDPHQAVGPIRHRLTDVAIWRNPARTSAPWGVGEARAEHFEGINKAHWWLVARVIEDDLNAAAEAPGGAGVPNRGSSSERRGPSTEP